MTRSRTPALALDRVPGTSPGEAADNHHASSDARQVEPAAELPHDARQ